MGNLVRDPELKDTNSGTKVVNFVIAVNRPFKKKGSGEQEKEVVFLDMEAWDSGAETIAKYFKKGAAIIVESSVRQEVWQDKEGKNRRTTKYRVNQFWFPPKGARSEDEGDVPAATSAGNDGGDNDQDVPF